MDQGCLPEDGLRVHVYRNLRRGDWSVRDPGTGLVIGHASDITLSGARFRVQPAGVERILRTGRRLVCAYAVGQVAGAGSAPDVNGWRRVTFNPWRARTFTLDGDAITEAGLVVFAGGAGWVPPASPGRATGAAPGALW